VGDHVNTVTARAQDSEGNATQAEDDAVVTIVVPGILVTIAADPEIASVGETVDYQYVVQNFGDATLTGIEAVDDRLGTVSLGSTTQQISLCSPAQ